MKGKKSKQWLPTHSSSSAATLWHSGTVWHFLSAGLLAPSLPLARCSQGRDTLTSPSPRFNLGRQDRPDVRKGAQIELSEIRFPEPPSPLSDITIGIVPAPCSSLSAPCPWHPPQYMNPDGMSLGLRNSTLGLCLLGWDL